MSETWRFAVFLIVVLSIWAALHAYVVWRVGAVPWVAEHLSRRTLIAVAAVLWLSYPLARVLERRGIDALGTPLEIVGATWMGVLFLLFFALLAADILAIPFAIWKPEAAPSLRLAAAALALALGAVGIVQFLRGPAVVEHEVALPGLPAERDGTVLVAVSDLHVGSMLGPRWLRSRVRQVEALRPDAIAVVGDLVDGSADHMAEALPVLRELRAPLGVWAVTGNHEFYAGLERSVKLLEDAGYTVLRDRSVEVVPGLVFAGVDDLTARRQFGRREDPLATALGGRPDGATVLLSHTPWLAEDAAEAGAGLMLSGHTHDGQIWPFNFVVKLQYPYIAGRYDVGTMTLVVCRGTGVWGPPLRLWRRSEILKITLRAGG
ncbi:MAG: metallophosphoesterase [Acidobacteriota bacterium]